jgi:hypothetical protein
MLDYQWVHNEFVAEYCDPLQGNPSNWWRHPVIGDFYINILNGQVSQAQYALIMNDLIKNRPP